MRGCTVVWSVPATWDVLLNERWWCRPSSVVIAYIGLVYHIQHIMSTKAIGLERRVSGVPSVVVCGTSIV